MPNWHHFGGEKVQIQCTYQLGNKIPENMYVVTITDLFDGS